MLELLTHKLFLSSITIIISLSVTIYLARKYKLSQYQILIYILLVLFWSAINLIRAYRKAYAGGALEAGGLAMDGIMAANIAAAYGLISIFVRLPIFALSDFFKSRKFFIALALVFIIVSSVMVYFNPNYDTLMFSSLALGLGASMLSLFNVLFSETFSAKQAIMSVSILSVAPLLAEFLVAPIQYIFTATKPNDYPGMWLTSAVIGVVALIFLFFVKDNKEDIRNFNVQKFKQALTNPWFMSIALSGVIVSFIRFSTSGSNLISFVRMEGIDMHPLMVAYIDVGYAVAQLFGGVMVGLSLKKLIGVKKSLILGLAMSAIFTLICSFSTNSWLIFLITPLSGLGYGITYNILLGLAMQPFEKDMREITMGIYQTFFAIGIFYGDKIYALLLQLLPQTLTGLELSQWVFMLITGLSLITIVFIQLVFNKKHQTFFED
jgi:MFS family permease